MLPGDWWTMLVWMALLMAPSACLAQLDIVPSPNKTIKLVEKIRRQLMENNYDYEPSEDDRDTTTPDGAVTQSTDSLDFEDQRSFNVSRKDLLYYMNVDGRRNVDENNIGAPLSEELENNSAETTTTTTVKYKIIKIKDPNPSRRTLSYQRYIQEESEAGVSIIRLDDAAPFPQFHLPSARRQYMEDGAVDAGDDTATVTVEVDTN